MPIPKPNKSEEQNDFISRCMGNPTMVKDYEQKQRAAICYSQWKKRQKAEGSGPYWAEVEEEVIAEVLKDRGILVVDMSSAKVHTQCDNCKITVDTKKPKPTKNIDGTTSVKPNPAIQAELETGVDTGETKTYHFCDEECLRQYLNKRAKVK
jgi:hypothetical protein